MDRKQKVIFLAWLILALASLVYAMQNFPPTGTEFNYVPGMIHW